MRTYALYERSIRILLFLCTCGLAVVVFGAWSVITGHYTKKDVKYSSLGCVLPIDVSDANHFAAAWTGMLFLDTLIFCMTVYKSFRRSRGGDRPLLDVLLRDGAIYFGIMAAVGLANILTFHLSPEYERGFIMTFHNIISSTMISRLMLNLRDPALAAPHPEARSVTGPIEFNPGTDVTTTTGLGSRY
ncbi:hypothetical protein FPV67DRAFT_924780 [Lyophyllum atratum]|nr:hypothetical protein FPV67DRAFT_924780 [Lyophyllum atratum]